ncbi:hypothetical protein OKW26_003500 [Paraburkholderia sp. 32]
MTEWRSSTRAIQRHLNCSELAVSLNKEGVQ